MQITNKNKNNKVKKELVHEISQILRNLAEQEKDWEPKSITFQILNNHELKGDVDFYRTTSYDGVRPLVRKLIQEWSDIDPRIKQKPLLPEYDYVQQYYSIKRGQEYVGVFIHNMTDEEIEQKINELRKSADTMIKHADELERYKSTRKNGK